MTDNNNTNNQIQNATNAAGDGMQIANMDLDQNPFANLSPDQLALLVNQAMAAQGQGNPSYAGGDANAKHIDPNGTHPRQSYYRSMPQVGHLNPMALATENSSLHSDSRVVSDTS